MTRGLKINLTSIGENVMFLTEKRWNAKKTCIFFEPQNFALRKGTVEHSSQSPTCGAFLFPSVSIPQQRFSTKADDSSRSALAPLRALGSSKLFLHRSGASTIPPREINRGLGGQKPANNADDLKSANRKSE